ncbi:MULTISPECIES: hypothetical protein [unclassified Sinorhizobium]|uniref:hypothetical protein n=1 Tax=unclassified Sinorhizobium TaxID=2613772 RepID=UPI003523D718
MNIKSLGEGGVILRRAIVLAVGVGVVAFNEAYWNRYYLVRPWYRPYVYHPRQHVWVVRCDPDGKYQ